MGYPTLNLPEGVALPGRYFGSVAYYALAAGAPGAWINYDSLFDKRQKQWHRCEIADRSGRAMLTVPITKPHGIDRARWSDVGVSDHGRWGHIHRTTLETAYGRSPYFEFYIDRLAHLFDADTPARYPRLTDLLAEADACVRRILMMPPAPLPPAKAAPQPANVNITFPEPPYYQAWEEVHGFVGGLSILDLIFNLGPEAPLYLAQMILHANENT